MQQLLLRWSACISAQATQTFSPHPVTLQLCDRGSPVPSELRFFPLRTEDDGTCLPGLRLLK